MPSLYQSVDAVVLPSFREGLPRGLIEAGASGLPLVTTDVPGCREVVTHEVDGLLVPPRDERALAAAISRLATDPALCKRLGTMARKKALSHFDERIIIQQTLAVYRDLLGERTTCGPGAGVRRALGYGGLASTPRLGLLVGAGGHPLYL